MVSEPDCPISSIIQYIRQKGELRDAQIEAIETYLFLKIKGENKPLWRLFSEGFFSIQQDLSKHNISQAARTTFETDSAANAFYQFSRWTNHNGQPRLDNLEKFVVSNAETINYEEVIEKLFYGITYTDYLFSLPMGAGKIFLIAAFIYRFILRID